MKTLKNIVRGINFINDWIGRTISWLVLIMALVMFLIVILRYAFNLGWVWMQESVTYMHGIAFMMAASYTLLKEEHVRIDIIYGAINPRKKAIVDIFGVFFLLLPTCFLIFYYSYPYVMDSWRVLETSKQAGGLPGIFILKTILLIVPVLLALQGISQIAQSFLTLLGSSITENN